MNRRQVQQRRRGVVPVTAAHRAEVIRHLRAGALSYKCLCRFVDESTGRFEPLRPGEVVRRRVSTIDRGLVKRTLQSCVDRGDVIAVFVRRPSMQPWKGEKRGFYVYAPSPSLPAECTFVAVDEAALVPEQTFVDVTLWLQRGAPRTGPGL